MKNPLPYWRVDEVVECLPIKKETEQELFRLMPDAYGGTAAGEDDWPEPDAKRDEPYRLQKIWNKLTPAAQVDISGAAETRFKV